MAFNPEQVRTHLKTANFQKLFIEELGWDNPSNDQDITVDGETIPLKAVAQKRGLAVFRCDFLKNKKIPDSNFRRKIDNHLTKYVREHLIIFLSENNDRQEWQWVRREPGQTSALRTASFNAGQSGEGLIQKLRGLYFSLDEEETLTLVDATSRVRAAFDVERVTKRFYDLFKKKHDKFLSFIKGIPDEEFQRWYASVMLNRLMFIYFLQKKNFLDSDTSYLRTRLNLVKEKKKGGYYKTFLCPLFFEGFAKKEKNRPKEARDLLGKIPYLNGGLFLKHQVEDLYGDKIEISDKAFEELFEFFDRYQWHLDERPLRQDNEINPDVLGYIFEKYINQKQMGAYYTKEDITDYISKNTIIPWLFNTASKKCEIAFDKGSYLWNLLQSNPDKYIFSAVRHGCDQELPFNIAGGLDDVSKRTDWNKTAPPEYALPTEIWREVVARRQRYEETKSAITKGQIQSIEDFITYNLDIRQFSRDVIDGAEGPELVRAFWKAIKEITVLDPACGSGAFLFAALNILEDLYEACLERMQGFINDLNSTGNKKSGKLKDFREDLERISSHPNEKYYIYKSIIIQNLFGVDIMEEATEICKLRLFLKLAAQLEGPENIEPLPDIDFNIKAGNSLIGFTSEGHVKGVISRKLDFDNSLEKIQRNAKDLGSAFIEFRKQQTELGGEVTLKDKAALKGRLYNLEEELNKYLCQDYGINPDTPSSYKNWKGSHKPFHWWLEFYKIMSQGGFNVIIGNPPYLETREVDYDVHGLVSNDSRAVHVMFIEICTKLLEKNGTFSMIVPMALVSTQRMKIAQSLIEKDRSTWYSNYAWRPGKLFDTVNRALTIFVATPSQNPVTMTTNYQKWNSDSRPFLMKNLNYISTERGREYFWVPKLGNKIEKSILKKLGNSSKTVANFIRRAENRIYYRTTGGLYWKVFTDFPPKFFLNGKKGRSSRETTFSVIEKKLIHPIIASLSSDIFWYWYTISSNLRDLNPTDINSFPIPSSAIEDQELLKAGKAYVQDLDKNSHLQVRNQKKTGKTETQSFKIQKSKPIIDQIDVILARHYGFTDEEIDFIINYDIKFRMGADDEEGDE